MTVAELIEHLQKFPPDLRVFVDGYEGGVDDLKQVRAVSVKLNENDHLETWYGRHELEEYGGQSDCEGVLLPRS